MKYKKVKLSILLFCLSLTIVNAQEAFTATGGDASGTGGTVCYSIGSLVYTTNAGTSGSVAQGVQQPYEISVVTGIDEPIGINFSCSVFPNPTTDILTLKVQNPDNTNLWFQLFDLNGKLLESKKIEVSETYIDMSNLVPTTYFLNVVDKKMKIKIFKIIKN